MYHTGTAIVSIRVNFLEVNVRIIRGLNVKSEDTTISHSPIKITFLKIASK